MTPSPSMDLDAALSRARMLFSMLSSPKLRAALGARLTEREQIDIADRPTGAEHRNGTRDAAQNWEEAYVKFMSSFVNLSAYVKLMSTHSLLFVRKLILTL